MSMKRFGSLLVIALSLLSVANAQQSAGRTRMTSMDAIRAADQEWLKVFAAKDLDKSVAFVTDDGSVLAPNAPIATGHAAIRQLFSGFFALPNLKISWHPVRVEVARSGELGYTSGAYEMIF